ncbi:hypothetical protein HUK65_00995 [Rhodobacteraceae bacterium 2376]|uniref:Uncharacterized protein n=1 Tax=Rhabdonatronobacter sediminivivens TaxID=2743469 RepID=A0A7Z0HWC7_9RHOB|nr:hypothetical protein [Rhabdonatronobacter sediminivivens]NYS23551.1 hypothetical protein [Rhabdonatronobacter sediminivivens]
MPNTRAIPMPHPSDPIRRMAEGKDRISRNTCFSAVLVERMEDGGRWHLRA